MKFFYLAVTGVLTAASIQPSAPHGAMSMEQQLEMLAALELSADWTAPPVRVDPVI